VYRQVGIFELFLIAFSTT